MFGLVAADPGRDPAIRRALAQRLDELMLPAYCITEDDTPFFEGVPEGEAFVHRVCAALLRPDTPIPADRLLKALSAEVPKPANAMRKALQLQLSLLPALRLRGRVRQVLAGHMLGEDLLVPYVDERGLAECTLPAGVWTELIGGRTHELQLRDVYSLTEQPVLVRANTLLPVGINSRMVMYDEADRVTLHWFQPEKEAEVRLAAGEIYHVTMTEEGTVKAEADTKKPWRLIVHRDGEEWLIR